MAREGAGPNLRPGVRNGICGLGQPREAPLLPFSLLPGCGAAGSGRAGRQREVVRGGPAGVEGALSRPGPEGLRAQRLWRAP